MTRTPEGSPQHRRERLSAFGWVPADPPPLRGAHQDCPRCGGEPVDLAVPNAAPLDFYVCTNHDDTPVSWSPVTGEVLA